VAGIVDDVPEAVTVHDLIDFDESGDSEIVIINRSNL
jgi:hypothetical protein